jgi:hypothetical protein
MLLMLFIGIDKWNRLRLLKQALTHNKWKESFNWIISYIKKAISEF